jgi:hypothetical protein
MAPTINAGANAAPIRKPGNGTGEIHSIVNAATNQSVAKINTKSILGNRKK